MKRITYSIIFLSLMAVFGLEGSKKIYHDERLKDIYRVGDVATIFSRHHGYSIKAEIASFEKNPMEKVGLELIEYPLKIRKKKYRAKVWVYSNSIRRLSEGIATESTDLASAATITPGRKSKFQVESEIFMDRAGQVLRSIYLFQSPTEGSSNSEYDAIKKECEEYDKELKRGALDHADFKWKSEYRTFDWILKNYMLNPGFTLSSLVFKFLEYVVDLSANAMPEKHGKKLRGMYKLTTGIGEVFGSDIKSLFVGDEQSASTKDKGNFVEEALNELASKQVVVNITDLTFSPIYGNDWKDVARRVGHSESQFKEFITKKIQVYNLKGYVPKQRLKTDLSAKLSKATQGLREKLNVKKKSLPYNKSWGSSQNAPFVSSLRMAKSVYDKRNQGFGELAGFLPSGKFNSRSSFESFAQHFTGHRVSEVRAKQILAENS